MRTPDQLAGTSREALGAVWRKQLVAWHAIAALIWGVAVVIAFVEPPGPHGRPILLAVLALMAANYVVLGVRALLQGPGRSGVAYHVIAWGLLCLGMALDPEAELWLLLWLLFPHLWSMLSRRAAVIGSVLAVLALGFTRWAVAHFDVDQFGQIFVTFAGSLTLSLALGLFIDLMVREAEARAETIDALNTTRAQLAAAEHERGVSGERERLSREIHDTLAQGFTSVLALTRAAVSALERDDLETARARLALVESTAADNLKEARLIVAELTPGHLQARTLTQALERLVSTVRDSGGVEVQLDVIGEPVALGGAKEVVLLRAAQEALSNVRRHAAARGAQVTLTYAVESVALSVADDGVGFDTTTAPTGYGLDGLRARAAEVAGVLTLTSAPGRGTHLRLEVPR